MSYLDDFLKGKQISKAVATAEKRLQGIQFDAIAVRGNSGLLIGAPLAAHLNKNIMIVRKKGERSHSMRDVEGWQHARQRVLLVDDFIETGSTLKYMYRKIMDYCVEPEVVGVYLYNSSDDGADCIQSVRGGVELDIFRPRRKDRK